MRKVLRKIWRIIRIPFFVILVLYIGVVIYRIPAAIERSDTKEAVDFIHSQKLTMNDVLGKNLPPEPDAKLNNSTLQGIDANNNGIRDDAELAIFKLYPDSARQRSGALQYAKALQMHFSDKIFNSKTFVAVIQEDGRGGSCFMGAFPSKITKEIWERFHKIIRDREKASKFKENSLEYHNDVWKGDPEVVAITKISSVERENSMARDEELQTLIFNNEARKNKEKTNYKKYMTSFSSLSISDCDIDPLTLPN